MTWVLVLLLAKATLQDHARVLQEDVNHLSKPRPPPSHCATVWDSILFGRARMWFLM